MPCQLARYIAFLSDQLLSMKKPSTLFFVCARRCYAQRVPLIWRNMLRAIFFLDATAHARALRAALRRKELQMMSRRRRRCQNIRCPRCLSMQNRYAPCAAARTQRSRAQARAARRDFSLFSIFCHWLPRFDCFHYFHDAAAFAALADAPAALKTRRVTRSR